MNDITAVVLSIGEETTARAIESVQRQTLPAKDIITISNVTPFYKAFNLGASKVTTEFFVQVDSDMILDETCLEDLRACVTEDDVGLVLGSLRDPLMGRIGWIKLFSTKTFAKVHYRDLICCDLVYTHDIAKEGWKIIFALRPSDNAAREIWHTFGEHRPSYTPLYTYSKYLLEGRRYRFRKASSALIWHQKQLAKSNHPVALIARIALAHGIFLREETDLLKPYGNNQEFDFLENFLATTNPYEPNPLRFPSIINVSPQKAFEKYYQLGIKLRQAHAFPAFKREMESLNGIHDPLAWIAQVGVCHGLFTETYQRESCTEDYELLRDLLAEYRLRSVIEAKLKCILLALQRLVVSSYTWGVLRNRVKKSFGSAKLWLFPRAPFSG